MEDEAMEIDDSVADATIIERTSEGTEIVVSPPKNKSKTDDVVVIDNDSDDNDKGPVDVVVLDDDDEIIDLVSQKLPGNTKCINYSCESGKDMIEAPLICLSYFRVRNLENKHREVCRECYDMAMSFYDSVASKVVDGGDIFDIPVPLRNDLVEIDDSDSDDEENEGSTRYFSEENVEDLDKRIKEELESVLNKFEFEQQVENGLNYMKKKCEMNAQKFDEVDSMVGQLRKRLDNVQLELYDRFRPKQQQLRPIEIISDRNYQPRTYAGSIGSRPQATSAHTASSPHLEVERRSMRNINKPVNYADLENNGITSTAASPKKQKMDTVPVPPNLPPVGEVMRPKPVPKQLYFACRSVNRGSWVKVRVKQLVAPGSKYEDTIADEMMYVVVSENKDKKERLLRGKELAYTTPPSVKLNVGARVIACYIDNSNVIENKRKRECLYPGIIAESLSSLNSYRYLIFFDDGYAQYVGFNQVYLIVDASEDPWEDIYPENRAFIKKYLESYPQRPMVMLKKGQQVRTEYNGKWSLSTVMDVDCSLVQVHFESSSRVEWIYRGSSRLSPLYKEEMAASNRIQNRQRLSKPQTNTTVEPYVQYSRNDAEKTTNDDTNKTEPAAPVRAVAKKSTAKPVAVAHSSNAVPFLPINNQNSSFSAPPSKIVYYTPREQVNANNPYRNHKCSPRCREHMTYVFSKLTGYNPLAKPLLCGWNRLLYKYKLSKREINYKAPCGRLIRNIEELHSYLMVTGSDMTIDLFDFEPWVRCLAEFVLEPNVPINRDLSAGIEQVPIPVVNCVDTEPLNFRNYSNKREPMEGVNLNLDPEFLCGCDCTDNCQDKSKCACWQLTLEGVRFLQKDINPDYVGYAYRRLVEPVPTGIYECNSRCKCSKTCLNRVVQNPLQLKLQVFKTNNRGWGIRCLNDIPQGAFICIYAGSLLTEQMANEGGKNYGDEYLAELDYIEIVEKTKEDYEEEAYHSDEEKNNSRSADEEEEEEPREPRGIMEDKDFVPPIPVGRNGDGTSIRSRLRRRNMTEEKETDREGDKREKNADDDTVTISDDENDERELTSFNPKSEPEFDDTKSSKYTSVREFFGAEESVYIMDAKNTGNIGRFLNHSCSPNVFVQNVFVDTHDVRFPWVAFFALQYIRAGTELTWNYNYDIGSVPGKVLYCHCSSMDCKGRLL